jgi:hypothetical protein
MDYWAAKLAERVLAACATGPLLFARLESVCLQRRAMRRASYIPRGGDNYPPTADVAPVILRRNVPADRRAKTEGHLIEKSEDTRAVIC